MYKKLTSTTIKEIQNIIGEKNVICEKELMEDYSHDEFALQSIRKYPEIVVKPKSPEEVSEIIKLACKERFAIVPRGGATGLCGACIPVFGGVVLSLERMDRIMEIDQSNLMAVMESGVTLMQFYEELKKKNLFFPPHPGEESAMIGGVIATNAGGARAIKYGTVRNFVMGLEVVLPDGRITNLGGKVIKDSSGYSLLHLMVGSEGTLGIITKATLNILPPPDTMFTLIAPYTNLSDAIRSVPIIIQKGVLPLAIEFVEDDIVTITENHLGAKWPCKGGRAYLIIIVDGTSREEVEKTAERISEICLDNSAVDVFVADTTQKQENILNIRSQIYEALKLQTIEILDIVVPRAEIANHINAVYQISERYGMWLPNYGHAGDGNVHTHLTKIGILDGKTTGEMEDWKEKYEKVKKEIHIDARNRGGKVSGEHGIGITKKAYLPLFADETQIGLMKTIKKSFDPNNILNPGKIFDI